MLPSAKREGEKRCGNRAVPNRAVPNRAVPNLLSLLLLLLLLPTAHSLDLYVTCSPTTPLSNCGLSLSSPCPTILSAIETITNTPASTYTIYITPNTTCPALSNTNLFPPVLGNSTITITGSSPTNNPSIPPIIDCNNTLLTRFLTMGPTITALSHLTIQNCNATRPSNSTLGDDGPFAGGTTGGAVRILPGNTGVSIANVTFRDNEATQGGAIAVHDVASDVSISHCTFVNNSARSAGGALLYSTTTVDGKVGNVTARITVRDSQFVANRCSDEVAQGGAVAVYGGNAVLEEGANRKEVYWKNRLQVKDTTFVNNWALMGGAVFTTGEGIAALAGAGSFTVTDARNVRLVSDWFYNVTFLSNEAQAQGGGLATQHVYGGVRVEKCTIHGNMARGISQCPQGDESCAGGGGGINSIYAPLLISESSFSENWALTDSEFSPRGGAVFTFYDTHGTYDPFSSVIPMACDVTSSIFSFNGAYSSNNCAVGGAIWINGAASIATSSFHANTASSGTIHSLDYNAGGAVYVQRSGAIVSVEDGSCASGVIRLHAINFTENEVGGGAGGGGYGGAVFAKGETQIELVNLTFTGNRVTSSQRIKSAGGAVALVSGVTATVEGTYFDTNAAIPYAGRSSVISPNGAAMPLPDGLSGEGGAMFVEASTVVVVNSIFESNYCSSGGNDQGASGGAVSIVAYTTLMDDNGIIFPQQSQFVNVRFLNNMAVASDRQIAEKSSGIGGAVHVLSASPHFESCTFKDNVAHAGGSKVSVGGAVVLRYAYKDDNNALGALGLASVPKSGGASHAAALTGFIDNFKDRTQTERLTYSPEELMFMNRGPAFIYCAFSENTAAGESMNSAGGAGLSIMQSGRGGAIGCVASVLFVSRSNFTRNSATARNDSLVPSLGGGIYFDYDSKGYLIDSDFSYNQAKNGAGSQITSISIAKEDTDPPSTASSSIVSHNDTSIWIEGCVFNPLILTGEELDSRELGRDGDRGSPSVSQATPSLLLFGGVVNLKDSTYGKGMSIVIVGPGDVVADQPLLDNIILSPAHLYIQGPIGQNGSTVNILAWNADLSFSSFFSRNPSPAILDGLKMVNGTLSSGNGMQVEGNAWVFGSSLCGCDYLQTDNNANGNRTVPPVHFTVSQQLFFGAPNISFFDNLFPNDYPLIKTFFEGAQEHFRKDMPVHLDKLQLRVVGILIVSISSIHLNNTASLKIENNGRLYVDAPTAIINDADPTLFPDEFSLVNSGTIEHSANENSLQLTGNYKQEGEFSLKLPTPANWSKTLPNGIWNFQGSSWIEGVLSISFADGAILKQGDSWKIATFLTSEAEEANDHFGFTAHTSPGVNMNSGLLVIPSSSSSDNNSLSVCISLSVKSIDCEYVNEYANSSLENCFSCLSANSGSGSCNWCGDPVSGTCVSVDHSTTQSYCPPVDNCCDNSCSDRGDCEEGSGVSQPYCACDWFFEGSACNTVSTAGTLVLTCCVSLTLLCLISIAYYQFHNRRKREVVENALEELRYNLLSNDDDEDRKGNTDTQVTNEYIQNLQQQLFLKDVAVPFGEVELEEEIGSGTYGVVFRGKWRGGLVAVKMVRPNVLLGMGNAEIEQFKQEAYLMSKLRHPNIVLVMGISMRNLGPAPAGGNGRTYSTSSRSDFNSEDEYGRESSIESLYIISEYMDKGSLADIMELVRKEEQEFSEQRGQSQASANSGNSGSAFVGWGYEMVLACAIQAARGMTYLHSYNPPICHRDLKTSNLVVDDHWVVKVTDFGTSRMLPDGVGGIGDVRPSLLLKPRDAPSPTRLGSSPDMRERPTESAISSWMTSNLGTTAWAAPEMLTLDAMASYSLKVDVYSFGMVLWEMWEREAPFKEFSSRFDMMDAIRKGMRPELSENCPAGYKKLYLDCVAHDPQDRPNFATIVKILKEELQSLRERTDSSRSMAHERSDSFASGAFTALNKNGSLDWIGGGGMSYSTGANGGMQAPLGGRSGARQVPKESTDSDNVGGIFPMRKHSIVNNVLASPVLSAMYKRPVAGGNYKCLEDEEEMENLARNSY